MSWRTIFSCRNQKYCMLQVIFIFLLLTIKILFEKRRKWKSIEAIVYFYWNAGVLVYGVPCFVLFLILKVLCVHYRMFNIATLLESNTVLDFFWVTALYTLSETQQHQTADGFEIFNLICKAKVRLCFFDGQLSV